MGVVALLIAIHKKSLPEISRRLLVAVGGGIEPP
jgi:hypothetical protein